MTTLLFKGWCRRWDLRLRGSFMKGVWHVCEMWGLWRDEALGADRLTMSRVLMRLGGGEFPHRLPPFDMSQRIGSAALCSFGHGDAFPLTFFDGSCGSRSFWVANDFEAMLLAVGRHLIQHRLPFCPRFAALSSGDGFRVYLLAQTHVVCFLCIAPG